MMTAQALSHAEIDNDCRQGKKEEEEEEEQQQQQHLDKEPLHMQALTFNVTV